MTTSLDERPVSANTQKTVMIGAFTLCLGILLAVVGVTLTQQNHEGTKDFSKFGCSYDKAALQAGEMTRRQIHEYTTRCL